MENSSIKACDYCSTQFQFLRRRAKFCSNNCKQMAYYVRKGLVLTNPSTPRSVVSSPELQIKITNNKVSPGFLPIEVVNSSITPHPLRN